jgi:hypothetical protein
MTMTFLDDLLTDSDAGDPGRRCQIAGEGLVTRGPHRHTNAQRCTSSLCVPRLVDIIRAINYQVHP